MKEVISAPTTSVGAMARAATYYEINHLARRGITSKEIVDRYGLGEIWYSYDGQDRRVNMAGQLVRNELNRYYKAHKVNKLWSRKTGGYVKREGFIVFVKPGTFPDLEVDAAQGLPDRAKWLKDHDR